MSAPPSVLTVSQLNGSVRELLEFNYGRIWLRGELSNVSAPSSGHLYFTLKDDQAQVRAAMFKGARTAARLQQPPQNGQQVLVRARVSLYAPRGDYQLLVEHLEDAGLGALQQAYEMLKARLAAEGLFAAERKRPLPANPRGVAVLTSPSGAAVRDILQVLKRRAPGLPVTLIPVPVQGTEAPPAIVAGLALLKSLFENDFQDTQGQRIPPFDVVIVARGGGSLEDLWAFNDEAVVRALADMPVPVVSGVGHEIDFTIADFVVDVRAPTPSAAAELVSPNQQQWREQAKLAKARLLNAWQRDHQRRQLALHVVQRRLRSPARQLLDQRQRLDELELRLTRQLRQLLTQRRERLQQRIIRLKARDPARQIPALAQRVSTLQQRALRAIQQRLVQRQQHLHNLMQRAHSVSPLAVLSRGYAIISKQDGSVLRDATQVRVGDVVRAKLNAGEVSASITAIHATAFENPK
ncbi:exodeoxyribonuclease VII large subunit [Perlucidibaca aquatica]|uniref:exodeoxyribonuclease VII large subunit n=1 Tax=Perlucidibaca aquatica TaxID=1852776 RepID=UPI00083A1006|nr:exodeoxyribonuclease VII large subunit [Perlucidibaca aquatica]